MSLERLKISYRARSLVLLAVVLTAFSCEREYVRHEDEIGDLGLNIFSLNSVLIIPNEGCGGCISGATIYVHQNQEELAHKRTKVVFTGVQDFKLFKQKVGTNFLSSELVVIDSLNRFMSPEVISVYPQVLKIKNGRIENIIKVSPDLGMGLEEIL